MTTRAIAIVMAAGMVLATTPSVWAHDAHTGGVAPREIIATLTKAHDDFHGSGGAAAAKVTLTALAGRLAADPTPYNKWVQRRVNSIVLAIDAGRLADGENQLHELIEALSRPAAPLTRAKLKAKCVEFHDILHQSRPDAALRCAAAIKAYVGSLQGDNSALAKWAKRRLNDVLASFSAGRVAEAENKLHAVIAAL